MGNFNRDDRRPSGGFNRGFGGKSFGGGNRFGDRDGGRPMMHKATCSECNASCEVPFKPTGDRPVFCNSCFGKQQDAIGGRPNKFSNDRRETPRFEDKQLFDAICSKCGKNCQVPFKPSPGKSVFCTDCFDRNGGSGKDSGEVLTQIKLLNAKIDRLMEILSPNASAKKNEKTEVKKEDKAEEVVKEKKEKNKAVSKKASVKKKK